MKKNVIHLLVLVLVVLAIVGGNATLALPLLGDDEDILIDLAPIETDEGTDPETDAPEATESADGTEEGTKTPESTEKPDAPTVTETEAPETKAPGTTDAPVVDTEAPTTTAPETDAPTVTEATAAPETDAESVENKEEPVV